MSNEKETIEFHEITSGPYAFLWGTAQDKYQFLDETSYKLVSETHTMEDDSPWIVPRWLEHGQHIVRQYPPLSLPTLHREFAGVGGEVSALEFAGKYGLLGQHDVLLARTTNGETITGESLSGWLYEARHIGALLYIWDLAKKRAVGELGQLIIWPDRASVHVRARSVYDERGRCWRAEKWSAQGLVPGAFGSVIAAHYKNKDMLTRWETYDPIQPARYYVQTEVNEKLKEHVAPRLFEPEGRNALTNKSYMVPDSLLASIWVLFLMEIIGNNRIRQCGHCGKWATMKLARSTFYCSSACKQAAYRRRKAQGQNKVPPS